MGRPPPPLQPDMPDFSHEAALIGDGCGPVCGVDEAGRGPWAGPVTVAAVILDPGTIPAGLGDSKRLSEAARDRLAPLIRETALRGLSSMWGRTRLTG
jgi:ribonuclease HII